MTDWHQRPTNPFGRLLVPMKELTPAERILQLRRAAGALLADSDAASRWLGVGLLQWLDSGRALDVVLGLRPARGSKRSVAGLARQTRRDHTLLRFALAVGSDLHALEILRGERECLPEIEWLLDRANALGVPRGPHAITRARRRMIGNRR